MNCRRKRQPGRWFVGITVVAIAATGCSADVESGKSTSAVAGVTLELGPTTATAVPGQDFYDAKGRRWVCNGLVTLEQRSAEPPASLRASTASSIPISLTVSELAEKLRPRRLVGQYEYRLAEPDFDLAQRITDSVFVPTTNAKPPSVPADSALKSQYVIGNDDRQHVINSAVFPGSAFAKLSQNCTATMIGRSTALCAAHCFYQYGAWISTNWMAFGANNWGTVTNPFGTFVFDSITMPGAWSGNWTSSDLDWDFAVLEFSPTRYPGDSTGWMGTEWNMGGFQYFIGYPTDKAWESQWVKGGAYDTITGTYASANGARYVHFIDIYDGDSGACGYNTSSRCTGIQSTKWSESYAPYVWNEARRWDSTTHGFFDAYGNWP